MRIFEPAGAADLAEAYAYPGDGPWLRANMVASADGAATHSGLTEGLGGPADRRLLSVLRALSDVVVVGAGTVRAETYGPVRPRDWWGDLREGRTPAPPLAVISRSLDFDLDSPMFTEALTPTIVITCPSAPVERLRACEKRAEVITLDGDQVDAGAALDALAGRGLVRQLTEGGPHLLAQIAAAGRLDELCLTMSPRLTAGNAARVVNGPALEPPTSLRLGHVLEEDDFVFLRYVRR
ncbi:pyrimidine reductase family protein [Actinomadura sp. DC4]|uniref:pyrimidine reductase family protein n=1 Tax=Actinomadura sp. DC4 TaxID=3055069 RepID=UPI0025B0264B|nr:pyrimidine reductase family protein [Actinomadura sp. DC4]MDN3355103.1 pyrimidine reductase family protein [Actinomadura sp. DC4]